MRTPEPHEGNRAIVTAHANGAKQVMFFAKDDPSADSYLTHEVSIKRTNDIVYDCVVTAIHEGDVTRETAHT